MAVTVTKIEIEKWATYCGDYDNTDLFVRVKLGNGDVVILDHDKNGELYWSDTNDLPYDHLTDTDLKDLIGQVQPVFETDFEKMEEEVEAKVKQEKGEYTQECEKRYENDERFRVVNGGIYEVREDGTSVWVTDIRHNETEFEAMARCNTDY